MKLRISILCRAIGLMSLIAESQEYQAPSLGRAVGHRFSYMDEHIDMMSNHIALDKIEIKRVFFFLSGTKPGFILFLVLFSLNTQGLYLSLNWTDRNVSRNIGGMWRFESSCYV